MYVENKAASQETNSISILRVFFFFFFFLFDLAKQLTQEVGPLQNKARHLQQTKQERKENTGGDLREITLHPPAVAEGKSANIRTRAW